MNRDDKLSPVAVVYDAMGEWPMAEKKETVQDVLREMKAHDFKYLGTVWAERIEAAMGGYVLMPMVMTDEIRDAGNVHVKNRGTLAVAYREMLTAQKAKGE